MSFTESELWIMGVFVTIIFGLIGALVSLFVAQIKVTLSGIRSDLGRVIGLVELHDDQIKEMQREERHRLEKIDKNEKDVEMVKKRFSELENIITTKIRAASGL